LPVIAVPSASTQSAKLALIFEACKPTDVPPANVPEACNDTKAGARVTRCSTSVSPVTTPDHVTSTFPLPPLVTVVGVTVAIFYTPILVVITKLIAVAHLNI